MELDVGILCSGCVLIELQNLRVLQVLPLEVGWGLLESLSWVPRVWEPMGTIYTSLLETSQGKSSLLQKGKRVHAWKERVSRWSESPTRQLSHFLEDAEDLSAQGSPVVGGENRSSRTTPVAARRAKQYIICQRGWMPRWLGGKIRCPLGCPWWKMD